jgi:hypothetical protein
LICRFQNGSFKALGSDFKGNRVDLWELVERPRGDGVDRRSPSRSSPASHPDDAVDE